MHRKGRGDRGAEVSAVLPTIGLIVLVAGGLLTAAGPNAGEGVLSSTESLPTPRRLRIIEAPPPVVAAEVFAQDPAHSPEGAESPLLPNDAREFLLETASRTRYRWWKQIPSYFAASQDQTRAVSFRSPVPSLDRVGTPTLETEHAVGGEPKSAP